METSFVYSNDHEIKPSYGTMAGYDEVEPEVKVIGEEGQNHTVDVEDVRFKEEEDFDGDYNAYHRGIVSH